MPLWQPNAYIRGVNILHVLSQTHITGAEVYAVQLAAWQQLHNHVVYIVSDTLNTVTDASYIAQPIHNRTYGQRLRNIRFLRRLVQGNKIDVVHAHSRAASWVCYFALRGTRVPLISTVHGRQHLHTSTRLFDMYGSRVIAVCDNLRTHLQQEVRMDARKVTVLPNGFDFGAVDAAQPFQKQYRQLSILGRTTGPKGQITGEIIRRFAGAWLAKYPDLQINIVGGGMEPLGNDFPHFFDLLKQRFGDRLQWKGFTRELSRWRATADVIIGSGRVAIEALASGVPTIAIGEACCHGWVRPENLEECMASNFGDILPQVNFPPIDYALLDADVRRVLETPTASPVPTATIRHRYDVADMAAQIEELYYSERFKKHFPRHIPVLMYHKVLEQPSNSRHRIFVTKDTFKAHLDFFRAEGFTPITFKEYAEFKYGIRHFQYFPAKPVFLTFDDAYLNNYTLAFPLLKEYGYKCTIFSLGDEHAHDNFWDVAQGEPSEPLMNTTQKLEMQAYGIEFGSHGMRHAHLTELPPEQLTWEVVHSKQELERQLGTDVIAFAYPYGESNAAVKEAVRQAGYKFAVVIDRGGLHLEDDPLEIFRAYIFPQDKGFSLWKKTRSGYRKYFYKKRGR